MLIFTWIRQLVWVVTAWNMCMCWRLTIWTIGVITLPFRALSALHREKSTAKHFQELQIEIENLLWRHQMLEAQFSLAVKERKVLESMLAELEEQHEKAIVKIEHLEKQVQNLKIEDAELRETQGKASSDSTSSGTREAQTQTPSTLTELPYQGTPWKASSAKTTSIAFEGVPTRKHAPQRESRNKARPNPNPNPTGLADRVTPLLFSNSTADPEESLYQRRDVALSQSLFSALLSLLVGTVAYEAKDPCMPLVVALFIVVGMSLKSVVHFFSTIRHKPASDAVALLSFNWFILGNLTYPTLPRVARWLFPLISSCMGRWIRLS